MGALHFEQSIKGDMAGAIRLMEESIAKVKAGQRWITHVRKCVKGKIMGNRKKLGKTRIIKKFIWLRKLQGQWKFLKFAYIQQKCVKNEGMTTVTTTDPGFYLKWVDEKWSDKQMLFLNCDCENELTASGSFISDNSDGVKYKCTDCGKTSTWNFDLFPIPINITDGKYPSPREMLKEKI